MPTETGFFVKIDVRTDSRYSEPWWDVSSVTVVDGLHEKNVVYASSTIEVQMDQTFTLHQKIDASYSQGLIPFAIDEDILTISGDNHTQILSEQDGRWE